MIEPSDERAGLTDESVRYRVVYHDPQMYRQHGESWKWVDYRGPIPGHSGKTDHWESANMAEQTFLHDKEKCNHRYMVLKVRTTVDVVRTDPRFDKGL